MLNEGRIQKFYATIHEFCALIQKFAAPIHESTILVIYRNLYIRTPITIKKTAAMVKAAVFKQTYSDTYGNKAM